MIPTFSSLAQSLIQISCYILNIHTGVYKGIEKSRWPIMFPPEKIHSVLPIPANITTYHPDDQVNHLRIPLTLPFIPPLPNFHLS